MSKTNQARLLYVSLFLLALTLAGLVPAGAADTQTRLVDDAKLRISTGTAAITTTAADFTAWQSLIAITPDGSHAMKRVRVVVDLAKATTGFAATYTSGTISLSVARAVDGTNYRTASNLATATVSGTNAAGLSLELDLGDINPTEAAKVMVKVSAESNSNTSFPYVVYYQCPAQATFTPAQ